jgi:2'-5' RNA ligase
MDIKTQEEIYEKNWDHYSKIMLEDRFRLFKDRVIYSGRKLYSKRNPPLIASIVEVSSTLWKKLQQIQASFDRIDSRHTFFHPVYFHITLNTFGWEDQVDITDIKKKITKIVSKIPPFNLEIKGVNCFERIIFAQVFDEKQILESIFTKTFEEFPDLEKYFPFYIPHISLVRIETTEARKIIRVINEKYRDINIGEIRVEEIQIVAARPYLSVGRTEILKKIKLK